MNHYYEPIGRLQHPLQFPICGSIVVMFATDPTWQGHAAVLTGCDSSGNHVGVPVRMHTPGASEAPTRQRSWWLVVGG